MATKQVTYSTGTFTPTIAFGGGSTGVTYTTQVGSYTRIGDRIAFECYIVLSSKGSSTGTARIHGLPFTVNAGNNNGFAALAIWGNTMSSITGHLQGFGDVGTTEVALYQLGTGTSSVLADTNFQNTTAILVSGTYRV